MSRDVREMSWLALFVAVHGLCDELDEVFSDDDYGWDWDTVKMYWPSKVVEFEELRREMRRKKP